MPRSCFLVLALGVALCTGSRATLANGTIDTSAANIASGAGSPAGRTIVDAHAPPSPVPVFEQRFYPKPTAALVSDIPPLPPAGASDEALVAVAGTTTSIESGVHDFTAFVVEEGATIECTGPVTFRVTGEVWIKGSVASSVDGAAITFVCAGNFTMGTGAPDSSPSVATTGLGSPVTIDVGGRIDCEAAAGSLHAAHGDVTLQQRATNLAVLLRGVEVVADAGAVRVKSPGGVLLDRASVSAGGDVDLIAFGGRVDCTHVVLDASGALRVASTGQLSLTDVEADAAGAVEVKATAARMYLTQTSIETASGSVGDFTVRARDQMYLSRATLRQRGTGTLDVLSEASVSLEPPTNPAASYVLNEGAGDVRVGGGGGSMVIVYGASAVVASHGDVLMHAFIVEVNGDSLFSAIQGTLDFNVDRSLSLRASASGAAAGLPDIEGGAIRVASRSESANLTVDRADAGQGGFSVLTKLRATLRGKFTSDGPMSIRGIQATIDLAGADISTAAASGRATAPIVVEAFNWNDSCIVLTGARIRSGDAAFAPSGDVVIATHNEPSGLFLSNWSQHVDDGALPGLVDAVAIDAHSVRLSWIPRDPQATGILVERALGDGPFEPAVTVAGDEFHAEDAGLAPDTEYAYRVTVLTSLLRSMPTRSLHVRTRSNVRVRVLRARVVDKPRLKTDTVALALKVRFDERPVDEVFDPSAGPLRIAVGDAFILFVPAHDARWTQKGSAFLWKGPVGAGGEATVRVDPKSGRIDVRAAGYGVVQPGADRSLLTVRAGADGGSKAIRGQAAK